MTISNQQYRVLYKKSPQNIREVIASPELTDKLNEVLQTYDLNEDQKNSVCLILKDLLLNAEPNSDTRLKIKTSLLVDDTLAQKIKSDLEEKIMNKIADIHKEIVANIQSENLANGIPLDSEEAEEEVVPENEMANQDVVQKLSVEKLTTKIPSQTEIDNKFDIAKKTRVVLGGQDTEMAPEYIKNLPKEVQDFIFDGVWQERTEEIAKKYSLDQAKTELLTNNVLFVLIGIVKPEDFLETIILELGVSKLLAEQIMEDLEMRVFEYAVKSVENKNTKTSEDDTPPEQKMPATEETTLVVKENNTPEIRSDITPTVEPGETVHVLPIKDVVSGQEVTEPMKKEGFVQRPISVPRYVGVPIEDEQDAKPITELEKTETPKQDTPKYAVDPYREAVE